MDGVGVDEGWKGEGFGLALHSSYRLLAVARDPTSELPLVSLTLDGELPETRGRILRDIRHPDGSPAMSIEQSPEGDFRIFAPQFGTHLVDAAGATVCSLPVAGLEPWRWQRLLIGQVLPLLAALRGYEVLHAAAVVLDGVAFGLLGDPGSGKSTLAAALTLRGQQLLSDDVLTVSLDADRAPLAHRGSLTLTLRHEQRHLGSRLVDAGVAEPLGSDDKQLLALDPRATPAVAPLGALYLLARDEDGPVGEPREASVLDLMRFSYIRYVQNPGRLVGQLELQSGIAGSVPVVPVRVSASESPSALAERLETHMQELVATRCHR